MAGSTFTGPLKIRKTDGTKVTFVDAEGNLVVGGSISFANGDALVDDSGNELLKMAVTASAVNEVTVANAATGSGPTLSSTGGDTNVDLNLASKGTGSVKVSSSAVIANGGSLVKLSSTTVDTSTTTGALFDLSSTASTAGTQVMETFSALTTGIGHLIRTAAATTGQALYVIGSGANMTNLGKTVVIDSGASTDGSALFISSSGVYTGAAGVLSVDSSATTGRTIRFSALNTTSGTVLFVRATAATLTTGRYISVNDAALEVFGVGANGHIHTTQTTAPTIAVTQQNGITAAAITAGGSDVNGIITTTGTNNAGGTTVLQVTFNKTYTTAPKTVQLQPLNAAAAKVAATSLAGVYVSAITATTFDITIPSDASAGATPSWNYQVIA